MSAAAATVLPEDARAFLSLHGLGDARTRTFVADASPRQYTRLEDRGLVLMDDRHDPEGFAGFLAVSAHLDRLGLSAPRVHVADMTRCLALVEDLGDATYARCLDAGHDEKGLYRLAVEALLHLHNAPDGAVIDRASYDMAVHLDELSIFSHWFAPAVHPELDIKAFDAEFRALWRQALVPVADRHETLVLRDFHIDNLMLLSDRTGVARCGLLDFQDAILGPCEYDLLSLLQDARRDLAPGLEERMLSHYCSHAPAALGGADAIRQRYALLGAQRHARILGVFVRLCLRDGKSRYMAFLPRVLGQFRAALADAGLAQVEALLDRSLPDWIEAAGSLPRALAPRGER